MVRSFSSNYYYRTYSSSRVSQHEMGHLAKAAKKINQRGKEKRVATGIKGHEVVGKGID
jgi:hypothetical protein